MRCSCLSSRRSRAESARAMPMRKGFHSSVYAVPQAVADLLANSMRALTGL